VVFGVALAFFHYAGAPILWGGLALAAVTGLIAWYLMLFG